MLYSHYAIFKKSIPSLIIPEWDGVSSHTEVTHGQLLDDKGQFEILMISFACCLIGQGGWMRIFYFNDSIFGN